MKKKYLILTSKFLVIIAAFSIIYHNTEITKILVYLKHFSFISLIGATILSILLHIVSAYRMRYYLKSIGLAINKKFAIACYFTGMILNFILPGGIGGDGYKIYIISKLAKFSKLKILRALISDRASGMYIIIIAIITLACIVNINQFFSYIFLDKWLYYLFSVFLIFIITISYFISIKIILKELPSTAIKAICFSVIIQFISCLIFITILVSFDYSNINSLDSLIIYLILFFISSLVSVIPFSIGGVGLRELTFLYGTKIFNLNSELGITVAILFFAITLISSLPGLFFWHRLEKIFVHGS